MTQAKLAFQIGHVSFSGEGSEEWVASQLDHFLTKIPEISRFTPSSEKSSERITDTDPPTIPVNVGSLAAHIKSKGGETNQVKRFLATADWLRLKGEKNLGTGAISKALQENHQKRLANAGSCLNRNVRQGLCEKTANGFFITPEGLTALGHDPFGGLIAPSLDPTADPDSDAVRDAKPKKRKKRPVPPPGASCRDRINKLRESGFFKATKSVGDIVEGLGKKGWTHNASQVGASLTIMFNKDEIQRTREDGTFKYYWDRG